MLESFECTLRMFETILKRSTLSINSSLNRNQSRNSSGREEIYCRGRKKKSSFDFVSLFRTMDRKNNLRNLLCEPNGRIPNYVIGLGEKIVWFLFV
jgi:hypothetical protein